MASMLTKVPDRHLVCFAQFQKAANYTALGFEEDMNYQGHDLNNGRNDEKQPDPVACRSFCKSTYPNAIFFTWIGEEYKNEVDRLTCWCKDGFDYKNSLVGGISGGIQGMCDVGWAIL